MQDFSEIINVHFQVSTGFRSQGHKKDGLFCDGFAILWLEVKVVSFCIWR